MANDLTGQYIKDTYKKVLQVGTDGNMYDGTGSLYIPRSASFEINKETSSSYAETASFSTDFTVANTLTCHKDISARTITMSSQSIFKSGFSVQTGNIIALASKAQLSSITVGINPSIPGGSITASGDISSSGTVYGVTGSFPHIITTGQTIEFRDKIGEDGVRIGSLKYDKDEGFELRNQADDGRQKIKLSQVDAEVLLANNEITQGNTKLSNSNVYTTGNISGSNINATSILKAPGFTASNKLLQLGSSTNRKQELVVYGKIQQKGSDITLMSGSISASGDISSSATVRALSGSFGTGTTTITDKIHTDGEIYATRNITSGKGLIAAEAIQSNQELRAPGFTASARLLQLGSETNRKQELVVFGKLQVKGSDFTIMSGSVTASGDISASGNISAGNNCTGSFDHIITLDDTIEFRNKANKKQVRGYIKFDPTNGVTPLDGNKADLPRLADRLTTARKIGGVSFDGRSNITPKSHMGSDSIIRILPNDFPTGNLVYNVGIKAASLVNLNQKIQTVYLTTQIPIGTTISSITAYGSGKNSIVTLRGLNIDGSYATSALVFTNEKTKFAGTEVPLGYGVEHNISNKSDVYTSAASNYLVISLTLAPEGGTFTGLIMSFS